MASTLDSLDWENLDIATSSLSELDSLSAHIKSQQESLYLLVDKLQELQIKIVPMYHEILHDLDNGIKHFEGPVTPALANNAALMRFRQHWPQLKAMYLVNLEAFEASRFAFMEFIDKCGIAHREHEEELEQIMASRDVLLQLRDKEESVQAEPAAKKLRRSARLEEQARSA